MDRWKYARLSKCDVASEVAKCFRADGGRTVATLSRLVGDIDLAEDALQEAYVTALERWPRDGFPTRPSAWIFTTARNCAINKLRRERTGREKAQRSALLDRAAVSSDTPEDDEVTSVPDDRLALIFACCHPALNVESRIALTLRTLAGLTTEEIADAFLVPHATMAQRLVRVKRKIRETRIPFDVPPPQRLPERIDDVCVVLYLIFNEGYTATDGDQIVRRELCDEAIRLCRILVNLMPAEPEVMGLLALLLYIDSRREARLSKGGQLVLLADQDRSRWNHGQIQEADALLCDAVRHGVAGSYLVQAWIASMHAHAKTADDVDWSEIVRLYDQLQQLQPSPIVALNRAVAVSFAYGPAEAIKILDGLACGDLIHYSMFHLARADTLKRLDRIEEAIGSYNAALDLTHNAAERRHLQALIDSIDER